MAYTRYLYTTINWINKSEGLTTPLGKTNLNHMDSGIYKIAENLDVAYNELNTGKFDEANADKVIVGMPTWDADTGILTFQFYDGTEFSVDFNIEKIPVSFSMDSAGVITMTTEDGTQWTANIGDVIPDYKFEDSDRIALTKTKNADGSFTIVADIKKNSITGDYLEPDYLANITTQASNASSSAESAADSANDAAYDAKLAQSYAVGGSDIRDGENTDNAKYYKEQAKNSEDSASNSASSALASSQTATTKANEAATSATNASISESNANTYATNASNSATSASGSSTTATQKASEASSSASSASQSASSASAYSTKSQSYAVGGTGTRENEDIDNAKYYYQQSKSISESFSGALRPMGTVAFANLPSVANASEGDMYNISDQFTTTTAFKEGSGLTIPAGSNIYKTYDGYWDILAGSPVTGVKGSDESVYRKGNVNITPENIGLGNVANERQYSANNPQPSVGKLTTARTIQTKLDSTSSASFDGSANITPGVTGTLPVANGGTGKSTLASGQVLVGNGTGAVNSRPIDAASGGTANSTSLITSGAVKAGLKELIKTTKETLTIPAGSQFSYTQVTPTYSSKAITVPDGYSILDVVLDGVRYRYATDANNFSVVRALCNSSTNVPGVIVSYNATSGSKTTAQDIFVTIMVLFIKN